MPKLVLDENINRRALTELRNRGRDVEALGELNLKGVKDPGVLRSLTSRFPDGFVLVTGDASMPDAHRDVILEVEATLAVIRPHDARWCLARGLDLDEGQYERETIQRWAHRMEELQRGEIRMFDPLRHHRLRL